MQTLVIVWQRLLSLQGQTCDRCAATELSLQQAVETLQQVVAPLQMQVVLHRQALTLSSSTQDPGASNRIWVADKPLEEWFRRQHRLEPVLFGVWGCGVPHSPQPPELRGNPGSCSSKAGLLAAAQQL